MTVKRVFGQHAGAVRARRKLQPTITRTAIEVSLRELSGVKESVDELDPDCAARYVNTRSTASCRRISRRQQRPGSIAFEQPVREPYGLSQFPVRYISGEVRVRFVTITKEK